jgi:thiol-disulfide isomerase/thioredoxin
MPNHLTGEYDAVVQIGVRQINGLLATLHQKGNDEDAPLQLLHSATLRVGDPRRSPPDVGDFGDWVLEYHRTHPAVRPGDLPELLTTNAPPGAAGRMKEVFSRFGQVLEIPPQVVRGTARVQISTLKISLPPGSTSEIAVHAQVRAHYTPDAGTTDLPQPVHGEVEATFEVRSVPHGSGRRLLIRPSSQDSKIVFHPAPGSGLGPVEASRLSAEVRKVVRDSIQLLPVDLPPGFAFSEFKGLGSGASQALALPLQLSDTPAPPGGLLGISNLFLDSAGFAFGIGRDFARGGVFQNTLSELRKFERDFVVDIPGPFNPTYHFSVTDADLQFNNGTVDLVIRGKATGTGPDFNNIVIRQRFALAILFDRLFIQASQFEPEVSGVSITIGFPPFAVTYNLPTGAIKSAVRAERDRLLPAAEQVLNQELRDARMKLDAALHEFDPSASARFRTGFSNEAVSGASNGVAIIQDGGVVVRGDIVSNAPRLAPHVEITEIVPGRTYSALNSWIPGGWVERLVWTWIEGNPFSIMRQDVETHSDEHRFLLNIPPPPPGPGIGGEQVGQVCLRLEGTRTLPNGSVQSVTGGGTCSIQPPELVMDVPSWWEPVHVPLWTPGRTNGALARDAIAAHVTVQSDAPRTPSLSQNTLVCFMDGENDSPLEVIVEAVSRMRRRNPALVVIAVLPVGVFDRRRAELERRLQTVRERIPAPLLITEDDERGWTRTFATAQVPSVYLINARREFVWQSEGDPEPESLAAALDKHLVPAPLPPSRPLRLNVSPGDRAPDAYFRDGDQDYALHRLRGRNVLLNFWQSWSAPCLKELQRLESLHRSGNSERAGEGLPFIIALHGGKSVQDVDAIRKELGLSIMVAQDAEQRIARKYGIRCWPTTVSINPAGRIDHIQFGLPADHSGRPPVQSSCD